MIIEAIIAVAGTAFGGLITAYFSGIVNIRKEKANETLANNQQAIEIYKTMFQRMDKVVDELTDDIEKLQADNIKCREENILNREKLKNLGVVTK